MVKIDAIFLLAFSCFHGYSNVFFSLVQLARRKVIVVGSTYKTHQFYLHAMFTVSMEVFTIVPDRM